MAQRQKTGLNISIKLLISVFLLFSGIWTIAYGSDHSQYEKECLKAGWNKVIVNIAGHERQLLWKGPQGPWEHGAIIALHGGGGSYTNWGSGPRICRPMIEFSKLAIASGFAVIAMDSSDDLFSDAAGNPCGKRFDCIPEQSRQNLDLPFIESVLFKTIPELRPVGSAQEIFMTGISNGGFMTILAATYFDNMITAFAPVSAGDPYGTHLVASPGLTSRPDAPGLFYDNETGKNISVDGAATADVYPHETEWYTANPRKKPVFKQFHNTGDNGVDISCMKKARILLVKHGYFDDGAYIVADAGGKKLWKHFWLRKYNQPLIEFFIRQTKQRPEKIRRE